MSSSDRNAPTVENNQGEVAQEMKVNSGGFFMHTKNLGFGEGDLDEETG